MGERFTILNMYTMLSFLKRPKRPTLKRIPSLDAPPRSSTRVRKNTVHRPMSWYISRPTVDAPMKESELFQPETPSFDKADMIQLNAACKHIHDLTDYFKTHQKLFTSLDSQLFEYTQSVMDVAMHHCEWKPFLKGILLGKYYPKTLLRALADVFHKIPETINTLEEHKAQFASLQKKGTRFGGHKTRKK